MIFSILIVIVCILLILVVLIQNSKGGGIQSQFGAANQIMGVKRGTEVIEKLTWGLAIALFFFSIVLAPKNTGTSAVSEEESNSKVKNRASTAAPLPQQQQQQPNQQMPNQPR